MYIGHLEFGSFSSIVIKKLTMTYGDFCLRQHFILSIQRA